MKGRMVVLLLPHVLATQRLITSPTKRLNKLPKNNENLHFTLLKIKKKTLSNNSFLFLKEKTCQMTGFFLVERGNEENKICSNNSCMIHAKFNSKLVQTE